MKRPRQNAADCQQRPPENKKKRKGRSNVTLSTGESPVDQRRSFERWVAIATRQESITSCCVPSRPCNVCVDVIDGEQGAKSGEIESCALSAPLISDAAAAQQVAPLSGG